MGVRPGAPPDEPGFWRRVRALFDEAVRLPPDGRADLLRRKCGGDEALRREVAGLLEAHDASDPRLDRPVASVAPALERARERSREGSRVGAWRLERLVARGGMGAVYDAVRTEGDFRQRAAVKLVQRGGESEAVLRRFQRERRILAGLEHPNIARLLDGGATDDGLPWLAMEYVEGRPIDEHCADEGLSVRERIRLFLTVCDAVAHAHRKLVVHRDLKPDNILVTGEGEVKLLDFGIAKLLAGEDEGEGGAEGEASPLSDITLTGSPVLTPAYASPEQVRGEDVTTATDVYALGLLLYELLTGQRPFQLRSASPPEIARVLTEEATRPSAAVTEESARRMGEASPADLRRALAGDLDAVILKTLRKEPERRYGSAVELAADLRRWLDALPVEARKGTAAYRLRKFVMRNRVPVIAGAALLAALVAGAGATAWQASLARAEARRAEAEAEAARAERARAEEVSAFLGGMIAAADPSWVGGARRAPEEITAVDLLDGAAERLAADPPSDPATEATIRRTLGSAYKSLGRLDAARTQLGRAVAIRRSLHPDPHPALALALGELGMLHVARGEFEEAGRLLHESLAVHRPLLEGSPGEGPGPAPADTLVAEGYLGTLLGLALVEWRAGNLEAAEGRAREALEEGRARYGEGHPVVATAHNHLGVLRDAVGDLDGAERHWRAALDAWKAAPPQFETGERWTTLMNLGALYRQRGRHAAADTLYAEALALAREFYGPETVYAGLSHLRLADLHYWMGAHARADEEAREAVRILRLSYEPDHPNMAWAEMVRGLILVARGRPAEAEPILRHSLRVRREVLSPDDPAVGQSAGALGLALAALGRRDEARPLLEEAHRVLLARFGPEHVWTRTAAGWLEDFRETP